MNTKKCERLLDEINSILTDNKKRRFTDIIGGLRKPKHLTYLAFYKCVYLLVKPLGHKNYTKIRLYPRHLIDVQQNTNVITFLKESKLPTTFIKLANHFGYDKPAKGERYNDNLNSVIDIEELLKTELEKQFLEWLGWSEVPELIKKLDKNLYEIVKQERKDEKKTSFWPWS